MRTQKEFGGEKAGHTNIFLEDLEKVFNNALGGNSLKVLYEFMCCC